jgi:hypothetical protein
MGEPPTTNLAKSTSCGQSEGAKTARDSIVARFIGALARHSTIPRAMGLGSQGGDSFRTLRASWFKSRASCELMRAQACDGALAWTCRRR